MGEVHFWVVPFVFGVAAFISFSIWVFDTVKRKALQAAEKWNEIHSDSKEEK